MKKYFFMALLANLIILPSCKKESKNDPQPKAANPIIEALDYCEPFYAADTAAVFDQLVNDGWTLALHDSTSMVYSKLYENNILRKLSFTTKGTKIGRIWMKLFDKNVNVELLTGETFKECMTYIGESYSFSNKTLKFQGLSCDYGDEGIKDFSQALDSVIVLYEEDLLMADWATSNKSTLFGLSKQFNEDENQNFVQITYW